MKKEKKGKNLIIIVPIELDRKLHIIAYDLGISKSKLIREAIIEYLNKLEKKNGTV